MTGNSGTPLAAKLGLKPGMTMRVVHAPKEFRELLAPLPDGARIAGNGRARADVVHHFALKKSSGVVTDVTGDVIRALALPLGFVDIKVCDVSDVWSGLKLVVRRDQR